MLISGRGEFWRHHESTPNALVLDGAFFLYFFPHSELSEQGAGKGKENCSMSERSEFLQFPFSSGRRAVPQARAVRVSFFGSLLDK